MHTLRIARPSDQLQEVADMYIKGLDLKLIGSFKDHDGFDGIILGHPDTPYHLEFTQKSGHLVGRAPTEDNLLVFYIPDPQEWQERCEKMKAGGFVPVPAFNPYWDRQGRTYEDLDGYRVVLQNSAWDV